MQGSIKNLPGNTVAEGITFHEADWGDIHVSYETYQRPFDYTPMLQGLPDNLCQSPHWGYVLKGQILVTYHNGTQEKIAEGNAYYLPPGHTVFVESGTEFIEFSPVDVYSEMAWVILRNMQKAPEKQKVTTV